jgi:ABC-type antimicrobial peptide transport system permease subunit
MVASVVEALDAVLAAVFVLEAVWVVFLGVVIGVVIGVGIGVVVDVVVVTSHKLDVNKFENIITVQLNNLCIS